MRPDNCGVIFEKIYDDLIFGTVNPNHKDFSFMSGQVEHFLKDGINVVVSKNGIPIVYHCDDASPEEILGRLRKVVS